MSKLPQNQSLTEHILNELKRSTTIFQIILFSFITAQAVMVGAYLSATVIAQTAANLTTQSYQVQDVGFLDVTTNAPLTVDQVVAQGNNDTVFQQVKHMLQQLFVEIVRQLAQNHSGFGIGQFVSLLRQLIMLLLQELLRFLAGGGPLPPPPLPTPTVIPTIFITTTPLATPTIDAPHVITIEFSLHGQQEVPPVSSDGTGTGVAEIDTHANTLTYTVTYENLTSEETAAHIHGMAPTGENAGILVNLHEPVANGDGSFTRSGVWQYQENQEADILAGLTYVNIHTVNHPGGEIRGQIGENGGPVATATPTPASVTPTLVATPTTGPTSANTPTPTPAVSVAPTPGSFSFFGSVTVSPKSSVDGPGANIDTIAFWEAPNPADSLMFVTAKNVSLVEVWKYPYGSGNNLPELRHGCINAGSNGVVVDQEKDLLYVSIRQSRNVCVFSLPNLNHVQTINSSSAYRTEPNLALLKDVGGEDLLYVSDDNIVYIHNATTGAQKSTFRPSKGLEAMIGDQLNDVVYIPDEGGRTGVYTYGPNGEPRGSFGQNDANGQGIFQSDAEGIIVYSCPASGTSDNGAGLIVVSDQKDPINDYEVFDRQSKAYLGMIQLSGVNNTDGIASTQQSSSEFPRGVFAAIDDDSRTAVVGWDVIFDAVSAKLGSSFACPASVAQIQAVGSISEPREQDGQLHFTLTNGQGGEVAVVLPVENELTLQRLTAAEGETVEVVGRQKDSDQTVVVASSFDVRVQTDDGVTALAEFTHEEPDTDGGFALNGLQTAVVAVIAIAGLFLVLSLIAL